MHSDVDSDATPVQPGKKTSSCRTRYNVVGEEIGLNTGYTETDKKGGPVLLSNSQAG